MSVNQKHIFCNMLYFGTTDLALIYSYIFIEKNLHIGFRTGTKANIEIL